MKDINIYIVKSSISTPPPPSYIPQNNQAVWEFKPKYLRKKPDPGLQASGSAVLRGGGGRVYGGGHLSPNQHLLFASYCQETHHLRCWSKELSCYNKLTFSNSYIFAIWWCKPLIFQIFTFWSNRINSLKYQRSRRMGC